MTDLALAEASAARSRGVRVAALQKAVAFVVLIALIAYFGIAAPN
jgi:hypothetical protein